MFFCGYLMKREGIFKGVAKLQLRNGGLGLDKMMLMVTNYYHLFKIEMGDVWGQHAESDSNTIRI